MIRMARLSTRCRVIDGRPVTCRSCKFVGDPEFPLHPTTDDGRPEFYRVSCCRRSPPRMFDWMNTDVEPFCGEQQPSEGERDASEAEAPTVRQGQRAVSAPSSRAEEIGVPSTTPMRFGSPEVASRTVEVLNLADIRLSLRPGSPE